MPAKWNWISFFVRSSAGGERKKPAVAKRSLTEVGGSWRSSSGSIGSGFRFEFGTQIGLFSEVFGCWFQGVEILQDHLYKKDIKTKSGEFQFSNLAPGTSTRVFEGQNFHHPK